MALTIASYFLKSIINNNKSNLNKRIKDYLDVLKSLVKSLMIMISKNNPLISCARRPPPLLLK